MTGSTKTDHVDVLIVGAGPAGLMMATWLAKCGVKTRIVDKRGTKVHGLQCRTLEIFDSFGFANRAWIESNHMLEISLWNPDEKGTLRRSARIPDTVPGISRFQQVVLHQGRIERFFLDATKDFSKGEIEVERGVLPTSLEIDTSVVEDPDAYPITVNLRHLSEEEAQPKQASTSDNGTTVQDGLFRSNLSPDDTADMLKAAELDSKANTVETIKEKYMLGADGAHSWVRKELGFKLEGESTDYIWGVLDIVPITDFPDIRQRCAIHSASLGSVMVIPRENKFSRLFSGRPAKDIMDEEGISMDEFREAFEKGNLFASGIAVDYEKSMIVAKPDSTSADNEIVKRQALAPEIKLGMRVPSVKILNQSDARPWHLQEILPSNGAWRLLIFPGNIDLDHQNKRMKALCDKLSDQSSFLKRFTPPSARYDSVIEFLTIHASERQSHDLFDFTEVLRPYDEVDGWYYNKVFADDKSYHEGHGQLYQTFGIKPDEGCIVVLRPDQYVALVGYLDDYEALDDFFSGFMIPQKR
ncbi:Phenol 2-monooxygenase [Fusarium culmorum]|uniref:Phenol 2-monooxygenase n=1 Tax=Fusarium culmorum TaxID=5516 RepID=A0A2T4GFV6_FUSCU|nr:Phenol 2-monooxygenase [Fusarium culmorum]